MVRSWRRKSTTPRVTPLELRGRRHGLATIPTVRLRLERLEDRLAPAYSVGSTPFLPVNLVSGAPGVFTIIQYGDDTSVGVNFGNNQFNFYGTTYSGPNSLFVSSNGLISFGIANSAFGNQDLTSNPQQATIAPLWDDWAKTSGSPMVLGEFDAANNELIVQWNQVQHFLSNSPVTFQAVLQLNTGSTPGNIVFNYPSIATNDRYSNGGDATVGIKDNGTQGPNRVLVSFNGTNPLVASNQAILFSWDLPAPVISSLTPDSVAEGTAGITLTVNGSNFAQNAVVQANGSALPTTFVSSTQLQATLAASAFAEEGAFAVNVVNPTSGRTSSTLTLTVPDAPLTATGQTLSGTEGQGLASVLVATFTDPGTDGTTGDYVADVTWDDGGSWHDSPGTVQWAGGDLFNVYASNTVPYAHPGAHAVSVTVADRGGSRAAASSTVNVADASLTASGLTLSATEGTSFTGPVATFTDANPNSAAGDFTVTISWGDGHVSAGTVTGNTAGGFNVTGTNTYVSAGSYSVGVAVQDVGGASISASSSAVVADAALAGTGTVLSSVEGSLFNGVVASFTDADPNAVAGNYSATIAWGDGHVSTGTVTANSAGGFNVTGTNTYLAAGSYSVGVVVGDVGGASANASSSAVVTDAALTGTGAALNSVEGSQFSGVVASFTDADPNAVAGNYSATITWGDGHVSAGTVSASATGGFNVTGTNTYSLSGNYSVGVVVQDVGGASANANSSAVVADAVLTGTGAAISAVEGSPFNGIVASFTDADPNAVAGNYFATITWGDGHVSAGTVTANGTGGFNVTSTNTYVTAGSYSVGVVVNDIGGASTNASSSAIVVDAALTGTGAALSTVEASTFKGVVASFTDADPNAVAQNFSATISWGEGHVSLGTVTANAAGGFDVTGTNTYVLAGSYSVGVVVQDSGGASTNASSSAVVSDAALTGTGAALSTIEGSLLSGVVASFADSDPNAVAGNYSATITWGDGHVSAGTVTANAAGGFNVTGANAYVSARSYSVSVVVQDVGGASTTVTSSAVVADAALSERAALLSVVERGLFNGVVASFTDADPNAVAGNYSATITWGDGHVSSGTVTRNSARGFDVTGTNTYVVAGSYSVGVAVQDVGGASANVTTSAQVADAPLSATGAALATVEGSSFSGVVASFTDADPSAMAGNYSATITWGDGHVSSGTVTANSAGGFSVTGTNTYGAAGNYSVGVAIQDSGGASANVSSTAQVADASLVGTGAALVAVEGSPFSGVVASFTDADPNAAAGKYTATINWGDGASSAGTVSANGKGGFNVSGQHSYAEEGSAVTSVTISDLGGASIKVTGTMTVGDAPLTATSVAIPATAGFSFSGVLATFSDADATAPVSDYSASIAWGDGSTTVGTIAADGHGGYAVQSGHAYARAGAFTVQTTVRDKGGSSVLVSAQVVIASHAALTATGLTVKATEGVVFSGPVASFTDADPSTNVSDFLATINWGDGSRSMRGSVQLSSNHTFIVVGSHSYSDAGSYAITVVGTVAGRTATARSTAKVVDSVPVVTAFVLAGRGRNEFVVVGAYADAAYERHTAIIHWGDGHDSKVQLGSSTSGAFKSTHTYQRSPAPNTVIVVTVQDDESTQSKPVTLPLVFTSARPQGLPPGLQGLAAGDVLLLQRLVHVVDTLMAGDRNQGKQLPATEQGGGAGPSGNSPSAGGTVTTSSSHPKVATLQDQVLDFLFSTPGVDSLLDGLGSGRPGS
jgi:hypothetical protein